MLFFGCSPRCGLARVATLPKIWSRPFFGDTQCPRTRTICGKTYIRCRVRHTPTKPGAVGTPKSIARRATPGWHTKRQNHGIIYIQETLSTLSKIP